MIGFLSGILIAEKTGIENISILIFGLILLLFALFLSIRGQRIFLILLCAFFLLLGAFRCISARNTQSHDISNFADKTPEKVLVYGTVANDPEWKGKSYMCRQVFTLRAERLLSQEKERPVTGNVEIGLYSWKEQPEVGDKIVIGGRISVPPGKREPSDFDYGRYLRSRGITAVLRSAEKDHYMKTGLDSSPSFMIRRSLSEVRRKSYHTIQGHLWPRPKALISSVVLGMRGEIDEEMKELFIRTGTLHMIAVSGLHVGIVALIIMGLLRLLYLPRNAMCFLTVLGIFAFAVLTGARPSAVRAALMGAFILFGMALERKPDLLSVLVLSAFIITFFQPSQIFRAGFILSYLAVLSIMYITPFTDRIFVKDSGAGRSYFLCGYFFKAVSVSLAVWIGMLPVIAAYFGIVTPSVVLANLLAVPVLTLLVVLGGGLILAGSAGFLAPVAFLIAGTINIIVLYFIRTLHLISLVPFSFIRVPAPGLMVMTVYYAVLVSILAAFGRDRQT